MRMKIAPIAVLAIAFVSAVMISPIHASYAPSVYGWTDKPSYLPGDAGVLHITVRNQGTQAFTVKNITVAYPWKSFIVDHWDGNFTTAGINQAIAKYSFTVPTDGRASVFISSVLISIGTDIGTTGSYVPGSATISLAAPTYQLVALTTSAFAIVTIALLAVAVGMLALVYMGIHKQSKK